MGKIYKLLSMFIFSVSVLASAGIGIVSDEDFLSVGVTQERIDTVKELVKEANLRYKLKVLDKQSLEIEMNKYILDGTEKNIDKLNELVEKVGAVDSEIIKDKLKYQIEVQKYISTEEYLRARDIAVKRLQSNR